MNTIQKFLVLSLIVAGVPAIAAPKKDQQKNEDLNHQLHSAVWYNDAAKVKQLISRGADINGHPFAWTSLEYAAYHGHEEICKLLIAAGANVNTELYLNEDCIAHNIHKRNFIYWQRLDVLPYNPLVLALLNDHIEIGKLLISAGANPSVALFILSDSDCSEEAYNLLISAGANVNYAVEHRTMSSDGYGFTPLIKAASNGNAKLCQILMKAGANVNAKTRSYCNHPRGIGYKPFDEAWIEANNKDYGYSALWHAHDEKMCQLLIDAGADLNIRGIEGETVLMGAVEAVNKNKCKTLLEAGADIKIKDKNGKTAIDIAQFYRNITKPGWMTKEEAQNCEEIYQMLVDHKTTKIPNANAAKKHITRWARFKTKIHPAFAWLWRDK